MRPSEAERAAIQTHSWRPTALWDGKHSIPGDMACTGCHVMSDAAAARTVCPVWWRAPFAEAPPDTEKSV